MVENPRISAADRVKRRDNGVDEKARALKDEWRAERLEWIDRTLRMLLFVNAGGAALTATYIVAVIQTEVPNLAVRALMSFLAGIASLFHLHRISSRAC